MDAQATVLAAERAAPKVVAARKEELDLEQRMQLVFEQEEMQQEQERRSAATSTVFVRRAPVDPPLKRALGKCHLLSSAKRLQSA